MLRNIWLTISIKKKIGIFAAMVILIMGSFGYVQYLYYELLAGRLQYHFK